MITSITILAEQNSFFEVGQKLIRDKKETGVSVLKIKVRFRIVRVYLSNGDILNYRGLPVIYTQSPVKNVSWLKRLLGK